jgi:hypothetical protein
MSLIKGIDIEDEDKDSIEYSLIVINMLASIHLCNKRGSSSFRRFRTVIREKIDRGNRKGCEYTCNLSTYT